MSLFVIFSQNISLNNKQFYLKVVERKGEKKAKNLARDGI